MLDGPVAAAESVEEVIEVLVSGAEAVLETDPGFYVILYELFVAGRQNAEIREELGRPLSRETAPTSRTFSGARRPRGS